MEKQSIQKKGINSNRLKTIAIIAMTIDHLVSVIWPGYPKDWWIIVLHIYFYLQLFRTLPITLHLGFLLFLSKPVFLTKLVLFGLWHGV